MHQSVSISKDPKKKPETICDYNATKFGVDIVDQMARNYSTRSGTRRWPIHTFYNILDLAGINAWVIFKEVTREKITRRQFLQQLVEELSAPYMSQRSQHHVEESEEAGTPKSRKGMCQLKNRCQKNKSIGTCDSCNKRVCGKCSTTKYTCLECKP